MTDFFEAEQSLTAGALATRTLTRTDNPPEFLLIMDVTHDETGVEWRQEVSLSRNKAVELTQLMDHSLTQVGLDWRPDDNADYTPPEDI